MPNLMFYYRNDDQRPHSAVCQSCWLDDPAILKMLLANPFVDPNAVHVQHHFQTALIRCCKRGDKQSLTYLKLLLKEARVVAGAIPGLYWTPLWCAADFTYLKAIKLLIASGKPLDQEMECIGGTAWGIACHKVTSFGKIALLLEEYEDDIEGVTRRVRRELGADLEDAASLFVLAVLLCDGFVALSSPDAAPSPSLSCSIPTYVREPLEGEEDRAKFEEEEVRFAEEDKAVFRKARRFFGVVSRLPLELQMVVCLRVYESGADVLAKDHTEPAFEWLLERLKMEAAWVQP